MHCTACTSLSASAYLPYFSHNAAIISSVPADPQVLTEERLEHTLSKGGLLIRLDCYHWDSLLIDLTAFESFYIKTRAKMSSEYSARTENNLKGFHFMLFFRCVWAKCLWMCYLEELDIASCQSPERWKSLHVMSNSTMTCMFVI